MQPIVAPNAKYLMGIAPIGAHDFEQFINPSKKKRAAKPQPNPTRTVQNDAAELMGDAEGPYGPEALSQRHIHIVDSEADAKRPKVAVELSSSIDHVNRELAHHHPRKGKTNNDEEIMATGDLPGDANGDHASTSISRADVKAKSHGDTPQMTWNRFVFDDIQESPYVPSGSRGIPTVPILTIENDESARITKLVQDSARVLTDDKGKPLRVPHLLLLAQVTAHVIGGDEVGGLVVLRQLFPKNELQAALRELIIMQLARLLFERDFDGKVVKPFLISRILAELAAPFDPSEAAKIKVFYREIVTEALPNNDKLVLNFEKSAIGLKFGSCLYTAFPDVTLLPPTDLERAMMADPIVQPRVLMDIISTSRQHEILEQLGPSALVYVAVNESNFRSIPLLAVDSASGRVSDRRSLFFGFRNAATFTEWLSLRFYIVCSLLASVPTVTLTNRIDNLVGRCRSTCAHLLSVRGLVLGEIIQDTFLLSEGPEAAVWGSNLIWKSFEQKYGNKPSTSKLRISNLIRLVTWLNLKYAISKAYSSQGCLVLSVHSLMDPDVKLATTRRKPRHETAEVVFDVEDILTIGYDFDENYHRATLSPVYN